MIKAIFITTGVFMFISALLVAIAILLVDVIYSRRKAKVFSKRNRSLKYLHEVNSALLADMNNSKIAENEE